MIIAIHVRYCDVEIIQDGRHDYSGFCEACHDGYIHPVDRHDTIVFAMIETQRLANECGHGHCLY